MENNSLHLITIEDIESAINTVLYNNNYITKEVYLKCGKPKYITALPGDLRSASPGELKNRLNAIEEALSNRESILKNANSRIDKKMKENEKLSNKIEKSMDKMEKAEDKIAEESDKIVNNINKSNFEDKINNWSDDTLEDNGDFIKNNVKGNFDTFRQAHNDFFSRDITGENITEYQSAFEDYETASSDFHTNVVDSVNDGLSMFNKTDIKNSNLSANMKRIKSNIDTYEKEGKAIKDNIDKMSMNQQEIEYITKESNNTSKEMDILYDEWDKTHSKYLEVGGTDEVPNPQMLIDTDAKPLDSFTFLPLNYDRYIVA